MKVFHNAKITVFAKDSEKDLVKAALLSILPDSVKEDIAKKKNRIEQENMKGESNMSIFRITIKKNRQCNEFFKKIFDGLADDDIKNALCERIDERCRCYIRLDKSALLEGKCKLTYSGDCVHIRSTIASYPVEQDSAKELVCNFINLKDELFHETD